MVDFFYKRDYKLELALLRSFEGRSASSPLTINIFDPSKNETISIPEVMKEALLKLKRE